MNIISRRSFLERCTAAGAGFGLAALANVPPFIKRALAAGGIGTNGKKVLFIFLRGANDSLNSLVPVNDPHYYNARTPIGTTPDTGDTVNSVALLKDTTVDPGSYAATTGKMGSGIPGFNATTGGIESGNTTGIFDAYPYTIACRNGFSALHPSLKFLAPVYNNGDLALVHRVGYPRQSRSHFDSQNYWENGLPGNNTLREGILYRTMYASGLANSNPLTGVSFQSALPLILQGSAAAMTNLSDPTRYDLMGIPANQAGNLKVDRAISNANNYPFASKDYRELVKLQYSNLQNTLNTFAAMNFSDAGNKFFDDHATDGDAQWFGDDVNVTLAAGVPYAKLASANKGYWLFPHNNDTNGGWRRGASQGNVVQGNKYAIEQNSYYGLMRNLKAAAMVLNYTDAICAGTEFGGFDTHNNQINANPAAGASLIGGHANLQRAIGWSIYSLYRYFTIYGIGGARAADLEANPNGLPRKCSWNDLVVVTLSEFGRTSVMNSTRGTDHAEAGVMWVAGGGVKGYDPIRVSNAGSGIYAMNTDPAKVNYHGLGTNLKWVGANNGGVYSQGAATGSGTLFDAAQRYLGRAVDYRSVLGEVIREHLGATAPQLDYIIPGYADSAQKLTNGGQLSAIVDPAQPYIAGELDLV